MKIGIQTNVWSNEIHRDHLPEMLAEIAGAGYDGIEIGAHRLDLAQPEAFLRLLQANHLAVIALHTHGDLADRANAPALKARVENAASFGARVGAPFIALSGVDQPDKTESVFETEAQLLNECGTICQKHGLRLVYHNHYWEIRDDFRELRFIVARTDPTRVWLLLDVGWVERAGGSPPAAVAEFLERVGYLHIKDTRTGKFTELGQGTVDLNGVYRELVGHYEGWLVVERDEVLPDAKARATMSRDYVRQAWGI